MKYKAIIFDMDGTIIDTEHIWKEASKQLIASKNICLTAEQENDLETQLCGRALPDSCMLIKCIMGLEDDVCDLIVQKGRIANTMYPTHAKYIEGFPMFHDIATKLGLKTAVATNACKETVDITDSTLDLHSFFGHHIYHRSLVANPKPYPDLYIHAAKQLGIEPHECIAIEDSPTGLTAAKNAGMFCIGITTAKKPEMLHDAHLIIDTYDQIDLNRLLKKE
jgi:beta-phosphoglucomutase-like phosphatase (HAD superfamily)